MGDVVFLVVFGAIVYLIWRGVTDSLSDYMVDLICKEDKKPEEGLSPEEEEPLD
jgi:hypothetical protein